MTDQIRVQEFGSEIEDILSGEISLDRFYSIQIQKIVSTSPRWKVELLAEQEISSLVNLANSNENEIQSSDYLSLSKRALLTAYSKFLSGTDFDRMHLMLRGLTTYVNLVGSKAFIPISTFEINRTHALGYYKECKYANAIKYLNPAVSNCPKHRDNFVSGLSDTLILLAECYSALGRRDDALHSARLAVNIAHERLELYNKESHFSATSEDLPIFEGPVLTCFHSMILSYCTLAAELEKSGMGHLSIDWYQRAYQAASKFYLESSILQELKKLIDLSISNYNNGNNGSANINPAISTSGSAGGPTSQRESINREGSAPAVVIIVNDPPPVVMEVDKGSSRARPRSALPRLKTNPTSNNKDDVISTIEESNFYNNDVSHRPFQGGGGGGGGATPHTGGNHGDTTDYDQHQQRPKSAISKLGGSYQYQSSHQHHQLPPQYPPAQRGYYPSPHSNNHHQGIVYSHQDSHDPISRDQRPPPINTADTPYFSHPNYIKQGPDNGMSPMASTQPLPYNQPLEPVQTQRLYTSTSTPLINPSIHSIVLLPSQSGGKLPNYQSGLPDESISKKPLSARKVIEPRKTHATELMLKKKQEKQQQQLLHEQQLLQRPSSSLPSSRRSGSEDQLPRPSERSRSRGREERNDFTTAEEPQTSPKNHITADTHPRKVNKTMIHKVLNETKVANGKKTSTNPHSHHHTTTTTTTPTIYVPIAQNPLLEIDEFGREKLRKIADLCFPYFKGLRVEAKYQMQRIGDRGRWYPGRIVKADFIQGLYDIEFENGDREKNISVENIRIPEYASKLALLQATTKSLLTTTKSKKKEETETTGSATTAVQGEAGGGGGGSSNSNNNSHEIPSRVLRKQYEEEMHSATLKLLAGVNQRADQRKIERLLLKNQLVTKVQSLIRGVLLRNRFSKIRQQLLKEKELRRKERQLLAIQTELLRKQEEQGLTSSGGLSPQAYQHQQKVMTTTIEVQTGHSLIEFHPLEEDDDDERMMLMDPSAHPSPHYHPHPHHHYPVQIPSQNHTNINSYLETPIETPHHHHRHHLPDHELSLDPRDLDPQQEMREPSVKSGKFINDHFGGEMSLPMLKDTSGSEIILFPTTNTTTTTTQKSPLPATAISVASRHYLQQKFQEIDKINEALLHIQDEQQSMKELDVLRNQELLQQFHGLQNLLIQQIEDIQSWKEEQLQQKEKLLALQSTQSGSFPSQSVIQKDPSVSGTAKEVVKEAMAERKPSESKVEVAVNPEPLKRLTISNPSSVVSHFGPKTTSPPNEGENPGGRNSEPPMNSLPPSHSSILPGIEGSLENSVIKSEDYRLLDEYGRLGVEDFWNSISSTDALPIFTKQEDQLHPSAAYNPDSQVLAEPSHTHPESTLETNQTSIRFVSTVMDHAATTVSEKLTGRKEGITPRYEGENSTINYGELDQAILSHPNSIIHSQPH